MTKKEKTLRELDERKTIIYGSVFNEHGEEFLFYHLDIDIPQSYGVNPIFVTGDEFDWELGYSYDYNCNKIVQEFLLSPKEQVLIRDFIIKNVVRKSTDKSKSIKRPAQSTKK